MKRTRTNKYERGLCAWPMCKSPRDAEASWSYGDESWILPLYCKLHGTEALARRRARIAKEDGGVKEDGSSG